MSNTSDPQPGWYPDPAAPTWSLRYWDGAQWTDQTTPRPRPQPDGGGPSAAPADLGPAEAQAVGPVPEAAQPGAPGPEVDDASPGTVQACASAPWPNSALSAGQGPWSGAGGSRQEGSGAMFADLPSSGLDWHAEPSYDVGASGGTRAKRRRRPRSAGLVTLLCVLAGVLVYFALPTGPSKDPGTKWFSGGVPGWDNVTLRGWSNTDGTLLQAWVVPGPEFGPDHPYLAVAESSKRVPSGLTAKTILQTEESAVKATFSGSRAALVDLKDGHPALLWTNPDRLGTAPQVPLTDCSLFALRHRYLYRVFFETTAAAFSAERPAVETVMLNFKATGT